MSLSHYKAGVSPEAILLAQLIQRIQVLETTGGSSATEQQIQDLQNQINSISLSSITNGNSTISVGVFNSFITMDNLDVMQISQTQVGIMPQATLRYINHTPAELAAKVVLDEDFVTKLYVDSRILSTIQTDGAPVGSNCRVRCDPSNGRIEFETEQNSGVWDTRLQIRDSQIRFFEKIRFSGDDVTDATIDGVFTIQLDANTFTGPQDYSNDMVMRADHVRQYANDKVAVGADVVGYQVGSLGDNSRIILADQVEIQTQLPSGVWEPRLQIGDADTLLRNRMVLFGNANIENADPQADSSTYLPQQFMPKEAITDLIQEAISLPTGPAIVEFSTEILGVTSQSRHIVNHNLNTPLDQLKVEVYVIGTATDANFPFNVGDVMLLSQNNTVGNTGNEVYGVMVYSKPDLIPGGDVLNNLSLLAGNHVMRQKDVIPTDGSNDDLEWDNVKLKVVVYKLQASGAVTVTNTQPTSLTLQNPGNNVIGDSQIAIVPKVNLARNYSTFNYTNITEEFKSYYPSGAIFRTTEHYAGANSPALQQGGIRHTTWKFCFPFEDEMADPTTATYTMLFYNETTPKYSEVQTAIDYGWSGTVRSEIIDDVDFKYIPFDERLEGFPQPVSALRILTSRAQINNVDANPQITVSGLFTVQTNPLAIDSSSFQVQGNFITASTGSVVFTTTNLVGLGIYFLNKFELRVQLGGFINVTEGDVFADDFITNTFSSRLLKSASSIVPKTTPFPDTIKYQYTQKAMDDIPKLKRHQDRTRIGWIAEDIMEYDPENEYGMYRKDDNGYVALDEIKVLKMQNATFQYRIKQLEEAVMTLTDRLDQFGGTSKKQKVN